jgi:hypothetical protein
MTPITFAILILLLSASLLMVAHAWALVRRANRASGLTFFGRPITPQAPNPFKPNVQLH